jgi:hypothetical protein
VRNYGNGELRGDGHIVVAPPSIHAKTGQPYKWLIQPTDQIPQIDLQDFGFQQTGGVTQAISVLHPAVLPRIWTIGANGANGSIGSSSGQISLPTSAPATVSEAIARTIPTAIGQRHRRIFDFARWLKGNPSVGFLAAADLEPYVRQWHHAALPTIGTKDFAETWQDFQQAWVRIRTPAGSGSLAAAWQRATLSPQPPEADQFKSPQIRLLVSLCRELQRECGDAPFYLSCRDAAATLGLHGNRPHVAAWRWLRMLCHVGILERGLIGSMKDRKANEYRYLPTIS